MTEEPARPILLMPVFEDRKSAVLLFEAIATIDQFDPHVVVVEDGSVNDPLKTADLEASGLSGEIVYLARNLGHSRAIAVGLMHIRSSEHKGTVVVMDSDGEDLPEAISQLLAGLQDNVDVVVARRACRSETWRFRMFYVVYRCLFYLLTGRWIQFGHFMALNEAAVQRVSVMQELWVHFAASVMISRLRIGSVPIDRGTRYFGKSQMNFVSLSLHGMRSIMVFAEDVLMRVGIFCMALAAVTLALLGATLFLKLLSFATPGWFSIASGILIVILLQAGILTFVTLMVSGVVRSASPILPPQVGTLIRRVAHTSNSK